MVKTVSFFLKILFISSFFGITGCDAQSGASISGHMEVSAGWKPAVYLLKPVHFNALMADYIQPVIDSAIVMQDGSFHFSNVNTDGIQTIYLLAVQKKDMRFPNHLMDEDPSLANYMPVVLTGDEVLEINATSDAFQKTFTLTSPSAANNALLSLRNIRFEAFKEYNRLMNVTEENDTLLLEREQNFMDYAHHLMHFADTTSSMHAAMVAIRWISPAGDYERMPEFIHRQCQKWQQQQPETEFVKELCQLTTDGQLPVMTGDIMPDFELPMSTGDTVSLHNILGQKLTIVDIWASWCAPCRKENRAYLSPLYAAYKEKGLQIIGYSIDNDGDAWQKAIIKDQAVWLHASHLTGDSTPFMDVLRITTIPANFILDEHGKVLAKNVYGEELRQLVEELLQ